jgi:putative ABC transport system permease protein
LERVAALPGVQNAAFAWGVPLTGNNWPATVEIEGLPAPSKASDQVSLPLRSVTPGYFALLGLSISQGRDVRASDTDKAPNVAVINQALADRYFGKANPIGKKIWLNGRKNPPHEVVGVVTNSRTSDLTQAAEPEMYLSMWQAGPFSKHLVVRTTADPRSVMAAVERELRAIEPTVAIENAKTLDQIRADSLASRTFAMQLLIGFSLVGSVLTLVGIYGVLMLSVAGRRREIAIRTAVGAKPQQIRQLIFGEGFRLIAGGVISGIFGAIVLSRVLRSFLFEVEPTDPLTLCGVGLLFTLVALLACWAPTHRAAKVDAIEALRYD